MSAWRYWRKLLYLLEFAAESKGTWCKYKSCIMYILWNMDGLVAGIWSMELFFVSLWIKVECYITVDRIFIFYEPVKPITSKTRLNKSHLYWKPQQKSQYWMDCYSAWALLEPKLGASGWQEECLFNPIVVLQLHFSSLMNRQSSPLPIFYIPLQLALF